MLHTKTHIQKFIVRSLFRKQTQIKSIEKGRSGKIVWNRKCTVTMYCCVHKKIKPKAVESTRLARIKTMHQTQIEYSVTMKVLVHSFTHLIDHKMCVFQWKILPLLINWTFMIFLYMCVFAPTLWGLGKQ